MFKRIIITLLLILFMTSMVAFGAPVYVNVGPTTELDGDIKILSEIVAEGVTPDGWETTVFFTDPTADRIITIPDYDVTVGSAILLTVTDNENTNENNAILFTSGGVEAGILNIESDGGDFYYNPSDGSLHATLFYGDGTNLTNVGAAAATALTISGKAAENIDKGEVVYISGATGPFAEFSLADNTDTAKHTFCGVAAETKTTGQVILIRVRGELAGFDTTAWAEGDTLYLSTAGAMNNVEPTSGGVSIIGYVSYDHAAGSIVIMHHSAHGIHVPSTDDIVIRMGDSIAAKKVYFKDYANVEVGFIDSDGKADFTSLTLDTALLIAEGGTNSAAALTNDRVMVSSGGAIIHSATITVTELGLLNGIVSVSTGVANNDKFVTQGYVDDAAAGGGANLALSNLVAVQINTSLLSDAADTDSLGTVDAEWLNLYIGTAGKIYLRLDQSVNLQATGAGILTITAANGVVTSAALTVTGALGIGANNLTLTGYVGRDADNFLGFDVDNTLKIEINNVLHSIVSISDGVANNDKLCTQGYADDAAAGGGANLALSNLAGVAINLSLVSDAADTDDLGSAASEWLNLYLGTYGTVYFGTGQTENIAETAVNELTITATTVAISGTLAMGANSITMTGSIGVTGSRVTKGWFTDLEVTNAIAGSITGNARGLVSVANADITIQPNGTGDTIIYAPADVVTSVNAVHTMTIAEAGTVKVSAAGAAYTITLPTAAGHTGLRYHFIKTDANYTLITLDGHGAETFNYENSTGAPVTTYPRLNTYCAEVTIVSDGTNWQVINEALGQVPTASVYPSAYQNDVTSDAIIYIEYDTETYDIGSNYDVSAWASGNCTATSANHCVDAGGAFDANMVGKRIKNTTDTTYTYITVVNSAQDVTVRDNIFVDTEGYEVKQCKFIVPIPGYYEIIGAMAWKGTSVIADKSYAYVLRKNYSNISAAYTHSALVGTLGHNATVVTDFDADDVINAAVYQATGADTPDLEHNTGYPLIIRLISKD